MRATISNESNLTIRVLTVNTHKGFTFFNRRFILHELREAVRLVGADVVFLQEVHGANVKLGARVPNWPVEPQYEFLADSLWPQYAYGRNAVYPHGHHGNAVLSKFPILRFENHDVSISGPEKRALLHCVLDVPGAKTEVHAICVHLGLREPHRVKQMGLLANLVTTQIDPSEPVVVAGDFNDWRRRAHGILARDAGLKEVFVHAGGHSAKTFPARYPVLQLDRIYVRNTKSHSPLFLPRHPWSHLSDHAPLAADIAL